MSTDTTPASRIPSLEEQCENQERIAETIRRTARWRRAKGDEYPEWLRENRRCASALRILANFVERLDPDDRDLRGWRASAATNDGQAYRLGEDASTILGRFGLARRSWQGSVPSEAQLRNVLRRVAGAEAADRGRSRQLAGVCWEAS